MKIARWFALSVVFVTVVVGLVWISRTPTVPHRWPSDWARLFAIVGGDQVLWDNVGGPGELLRQSLHTWAAFLIGIACGLVGLLAFWPAMDPDFWRPTDSRNPPRRPQDIGRDPS